MDSNAIILLDAAEKELRSVDVPTLELARALTSAALAQARYYIENGNIPAARDVVDKMGGVEKYIKAKVQQQQAKLVTQNTVALGRFEVIWELGRWLRNNSPGRGGDRKSSNKMLLDLLPPASPPRAALCFELGLQFDELLLERGEAVGLARYDIL